MRRTMGRNLSDRQSKILEFIRQFIDDHGFPPSVRDIQDALRISSTSVVDYNLKALEERQQIRRSRGISRAIELVDDPKRSGVVTIPLAASPIAAGSPIPVIDEIRNAESAERLDIAGAVLGRYSAHLRELYALRVRGQSMIEEFIDDGDIVIIFAQNTAEVGQTVVAYLREENEATLKKYYPEQNGKVRLQPANATMQPIITDADNLEIRGRVVSVLRHLA